MTDGGWDTAKDPQIDPKRISYGPSSSNIDRFSRAVAKISVAQILESADFCCSYRAPIETLAGVMLRYISHVGKLAVSHANSSGRFDCNVFDVIQALEEIESMHGFLGQSDLNRCLGNSSVIKDLFAFVGTEKEIPFARSIPRFPVAKDSKIPTLFHEIGNENTGNHIPHWLPAFPDAKMYENLSNFEGFGLREEQRKKKERPFFSLQKLFGSNGSDERDSFTETGAEKGKKLVPNNPFLVPAIPFGEREVSQVGTAGKISVIDSFAPLIEASKEEERNSEFETDERGEISHEKPVIRFRIGAGKKSIAKALCESTEKDLWFDFEKGDENHEIGLKKMRTEFVLKESMETD
ncbi:hypothetical protein LUZ60_004913 [Juncus effusus]|nr:hypothetical protein LUZ60_004913 [Juncus effusus]